jgi:hypothetical protein
MSLPPGHWQCFFVHELVPHELFTSLAGNLNTVTHVD